MHGRRWLAGLVVVAACGGSEAKTEPDGPEAPKVDAAGTIVDAPIVFDAAGAPDARPDAPAPIDAPPIDAPAPIDALAIDAPAPIDAPAIDAPPPDAAPPTGTRTRSLWFSHVLETPGKVGAVAAAFDTTFELIYAENLPLATVPPGITANLYLYGDGGLPMRSKTNAVVCNPCAFTLKNGPATSAAPRVKTVIVEDLFVAVGGLPDGGQRGFAVITLSGTGDPGTFVANELITQGHDTLAAGDVDISRDGGTWIDVTPPAPAPEQAIFFPWFSLDPREVATDAHSRDSFLNIVSTQGLPSGTAGEFSVDLYLYDHATGAPLRSATDAVVCNPCTYAMGGDEQNGAHPRVRRVYLDSLITSAGGIGAGVRSGFAYLKVSTGESADVAAQMLVLHSRATAPNNTQAIDDGDRVARPASPPASSWGLFPLFVDSNGSLFGIGGDVDEEFDVVYTAGLPSGAAAGVTVNVWFYDIDTALPLRSSSNMEVCNPCSVTLGGDGVAGAHPRSKRFVVGDLFAAKGGLPAVGAAGFAVVTLSSGNPNDVAIRQVHVQKGKTDPASLNLAMLGPDWQQPSPAAKRPGAAGLTRTMIIPRAIDDPESTIITARTFDTTFFATYTPGLAGLPAGGGATVDLFLFDDGTGTIMKTANGTSACAPCSVALGGAGSKRSSFDMSDRFPDGTYPGGKAITGFGVLVITGADPNGVDKTAFVANTHAAPLDLSVFAFLPQEISAAAP